MDTVTRAFELPVQAIECVDGRDGWALLRECWQQGTMLANWAVTQMMKLDTPRLPGMEKLPPAPDYDLYARAFGRKVQKPRRGKKADQPPAPLRCAEFEGGEFFAGAQISAHDILQATEKKYNQERLEVVWRRAKSPCTYRYPHPWPVHAQQWHEALLDGSGRPTVVLALPGGHVRVRMRGGPEFGRQMGMFRDVIAGNLPRKQLIIRQQGASNGCHRPTVEDGGRPRRVLVKMVADLPVREALGDRVINLTTGQGALWVAEISGRRAWVLNADHVKRAVDWRNLHDARLQRWSEDMKAERRSDPRKRQQFNRSRERACEKHRRRMKSWIQETVSHFVRFAVRQRAGQVVYEDRDRTFLPLFPWAALRAQLGGKLEEAGITLAGTDDDDKE